MQKTTAVTQNPSSNILNAVKEGMYVYDQLGNRLGTVRGLYFGSSSPEDSRNGTGGATDPSLNMNNDGLVEGLDRVFAPDKMPVALRDSLLLSGFITLNGEGLFSYVRYVVPSQIDNVTDNHVNLNVSRDELIRRDSDQG